jgi:hypothetical protein
MKKEDIIRMAREAGFVKYELEDYTPSGYDIRYERFAALVAAAEREACAKICESLWRIDGQFSADEFAAEVRSRGQK